MALKLVQVEFLEDGRFEMHYADTKRRGGWIHEYAPRGLMTVAEAAKVTETPRRTLYHWIEREKVRTVRKLVPDQDDGDEEEISFQLMVPHSEVKRILRKKWPKG